MGLFGYSGVGIQLIDKIITQNYISYDNIYAPLIITVKILINRIKLSS